MSILSLINSLMLVGLLAFSLLEALPQQQHVYGRFTESGNQHLFFRASGYFRSCELYSSQRGIWRCLRHDGTAIMVAH